MNDEKSQMIVEMDTMKQQLRDVSDRKNNAIEELRGLNITRDAVISEIAGMKSDLNEVNNLIAAEKLEWAQLKAREQADLDSSKETVAKILARESALAALAAELEEKRLSNQAILDESNRSLDRAGRLATETANVLAESRAEKSEAQGVRTEAEQRVAAFKQSMREFHAKLSDSIESM